MTIVNDWLDSIRQAVRSPIKKIAIKLNDSSGGKLTPNMVTFASLVGHVLIALVIIAGHLLLAGLLLVFFGLFDSLDGELARLQNRASDKGMLLDATTDRIKEIILYVALAYAIVATGRPYMAVWAVAACGASLLVSYVKAKGETAVAKSHTGDINRLFQDGLMRYEIRMAIVFVGLITGRIILAVIVITITAGLTALYRLFKISSQLT